jgi:hypothetical protein
MGGDEVGRDDGGPDLGPFGDDLEKGISLFFSRDDIAELVQTQERNSWKLLTALLHLPRPAPLPSARLREGGRREEESGERSLF